MHGSVWREVTGLPAAEQEGAQRPRVSQGLPAEDLGAGRSLDCSWDGSICRALGRDQAIVCT